MPVASSGHSVSLVGAGGRIASVAGGHGRGAVAACGNFRCGRIRKPDPERPGNAGEAVDVVAERTGPRSPVKLSGSIPPLAESFHQRPETGLDLRAGLYPGDTVLLTHGQETASAPADQGGTGKTQIAVAFSHALRGARSVDALVWVQATSREAIVSGFAQAAKTIGVADHALPAEAAADRFTGWLAHTRRPWALILDDLVCASHPVKRPAAASAGSAWSAAPTILAACAKPVTIATRLAAGTQASASTARAPHSA